MQKKNIAIIIHKMYGGGAERVAANLSTYLSDKRYNKKVITYDSSKVGYSFNGEIISLKTKVSRNPIGKLVNFIKRVYQVKKIKKRNNINTTISLLSGPNLVNILTRKDDKVIVSVRNFISKSSTGLYGRFNKLLIKHLYNRADLIVAVSDAIKKDLEENFDIDGGKIEVIYNFYDIESIKKLALSTSNYKEEMFKNPTIITAGRLSKQKGHWHLIRAFSRVKQKIHDAKLIILGEGYLLEYLKKLTNKLGLQNDVYFLGHKSNPFKYLSKADIYVLPSLYEGLPNALCEAMACGLPIISTDCYSGPREILSSNLTTHDPPIKHNIKYADYGILVPVCDGNMYEANDALTNEELVLSDAINKLLTDRDVLNNYQDRSLERIQLFHKDLILPKWENLIDS